MFEQVLLLLAGFAVGIVSGLLGVGGGILAVPVLQYFFEYSKLKDPMHLAVGTSLAVIIPTAIVGSYTHFLNKNVVLETALILAVGSMVGAYFGAQLAGQLSDKLLKQVFGLCLIIFGIRFVLF